MPLVDHPAGPVELVTRARPTLPCEDCAHAAVCVIRPKLDAAKLELVAPPTPDPAIRLGITLTLVCRHFLEAAARELIPAKPSAAEMLAASRARGAKAGGFVKGHTGPKGVEAPPASSNGHAGSKRSPEVREHMRQAQMAAWERRRAREAAAPGRTES